MSVTRPENPHTKLSPVCFSQRKKGEKESKEEIKGRDKQPSDGDRGGQKNDGTRSSG